MPSPRAPAWAQRNAAERVEHKAARIAALHLLAALLAAFAHAQMDAFFLLPDLAEWNLLALGVLVGVHEK